MVRFIARHKALFMHWSAIKYNIISMPYLSDKLILCIFVVFALCIIVSLCLHWTFWFYVNTDTEHRTARRFIARLEFQSNFYSELSSSTYNYQIEKRMIVSQLALSTIIQRNT